MQAFSFRIVAVLVAASVSLFAVDAEAQTPGAYLPPNLPRPPAAAIPPVYPTATGSPAPAFPSSAAGQIRLIEPDSTTKVAQRAAGTDGKSPAAKGPEMDRDTGPPDLRMQPRTPAAAAGQDPTIAGPEISELMGGANRNTQGGPPPLPGLRLRARIFARNKPPVAVIDVGGQSLSVRVGSEIQFSPTGGGAVQMKVIELTTTELQIEVVGRKQIITLN